MAYHPHLIFATLAIALTALTVAYSFCYEDRCAIENITQQKNFDMNKFLGKWYRIKWYPTPLSHLGIPGYPIDKDVIYYKKNVTPPIWREKYPDAVVGFSYWGGRLNGGQCTTDVDAFVVFQEKIVIMPVEEGTIELPNGNFTGQLSIRTMEFLVLFTDYDNYALMWQCNETVSFDPKTCRPDQTRSWVLSRSKTLNAEHWNLIDQKILEVCLDPSAFLINEHECHQYN